MHNLFFCHINSKLLPLNDRLLIHILYQTFHLVLWRILLNSRFLAVSPIFWYRV